MKLALSLALAVSLAAAGANAQTFKSGDIAIDHAWSRATPKGAEVGVGYLTIHNEGATPDKLTGGSAEVGNLEVHEMSMNGGVMKMRELTSGLTIPAHGSVTLAPNGYHLMFVHLKHPLEKGSTLKATLNFEHAGAVPVEFSVQGIGAAAPAHDMKGMKM